MKLLVLGLMLLVSVTQVLCQAPPTTGKPLVRCKRPLCEVYCPHGLQVDERGCETCVCTNPPTVPEMPCPEPMCANDCREFGGYKKNEHGCMTCECMERITCEELECPMGHFCRPDFSHCRPGMEEIECMPRPVCVELDQRPHVPPPPPHCPLRKCPAMLCEYGLKRDEQNCPTCACASDPCETHECHEGQVCELDRLPGCEHIACPVLAKCAFKSLCHHHQNFHRTVTHGEPLPEDMPSWDLFGGPLGYMPKCEPDGTFHPKQCDMEAMGPTECWCVDDTGKEMLGTRKPMMVGDERMQPKCERNHTESMEMKFQVWHEFEDIVPHMDSLKQSVKKHLSHWLTVEERFIVIVKIEPDGQMQRVQIHVLIMQDGQTDLPSAAFHMHDQMRQKHCNIHFHGQTMRSDPNTLEMKPRYRDPETGWPHHEEPGHRDREIERPHLPHHAITEKEEDKGLWGFCKAHQTAVIVGCVAGAILLIALTVLVISAARKKRASHQFRHKKFENYQKNLVLGGDQGVKHPDDLEKDDPAVAVISVSETDRDSSTVA